MGRRTISQREAQRLRRRVAELEAMDRARESGWSADYPGGICFWSMTLGAETIAAMKTAAALRHAVVAKLDGNKLLLFALRQVQ